MVWSVVCMGLPHTKVGFKKLIHVAVNLFLLKLQGAFVAIVYIACAPPQNPFLSQPLDTRTTREMPFKDLTGLPHRGCVCDVTVSTWPARLNIRDKWVQWHHTRFTCGGKPLNEVHTQCSHYDLFLLLSLVHSRMQYRTCTPWALSGRHPKSYILPYSCRLWGTMQCLGADNMLTTTTQKVAERLGVCRGVLRCMGAELGVQWFAPHVPAICK